MPLYELEEGASRKFYRVDLDGRKVLLHWGRIGTEGEHQILSFETETLARVEYDRQCEKRTADRGYRLVVDEGLPHDPELVSRQRLEKQAPLSESPRFLFTKQQRFAWVEARGPELLSLQGLREQEDQIAPKSKTFESQAAALRARDAMIAKLVGSGYELETFGASDKPAPKRRPRELADTSALEAVIAEDPYDEERWSVLEDFLLEQPNDPRGELVKLAKERRMSEEAQARGAAFGLLFGKRHEAISRAMSRPTWRAGYVLECDLGALRSIEIAAALFASPAGRLIRELETEGDHAVNAIARAPCARSLRVLTLHQPGRLDCNSISHLPLRRLEVTPFARNRSGGQYAVLAPSAIPTLEKLIATISQLAELSGLLEGTAPNLERLELTMTRADQSRGDHASRRQRLVRMLEPITSGAFAPSLRELRIKLTSWESAAAVREAVSASCLADQLSVTILP